MGWDTSMRMTLKTKKLNRNICLMNWKERFGMMRKINNKIKTKQDDFSYLLKHSEKVAKKLSDNKENEVWDKT